MIIQECLEKAFWTEPRLQISRLSLGYSVIGSTSGSGPLSSGSSPDIPAKQVLLPSR